MRTPPLVLAACLALPLSAQPTPEPPAWHADLIHLRVEEKLAHDVYLHLHDAHGLPIFEHIAAAEARHQAAMARQLDRLGLTDPVNDATPGTFPTDPFTALYADLTEQGAHSATDALTVGATIEDMDIADLLAAIDHAETQGDTTLQGTLENLLAASKRHLRAFVGQLDARGTTYAPQHLGAETYATILAEPDDRPGRRRRRGGR